jgi:hypothetical protein
LTFSIHLYVLLGFLILINIFLFTGYKIEPYIINYLLFSIEIILYLTFLALLAFIFNLGLLIMKRNNKKGPKWDWKKWLIGSLLIITIFLIRIITIRYFELNMSEVFEYLLVNIPILFIILLIRTYIFERSIKELLTQMFIGIFLMISLYFIKSLLFSFINNNDEIKYFVIFIAIHILEYIYIYIGMSEDMITNKMDIWRILNPDSSGGQTSSSGGDNNSNQPPIPVQPQPPIQPPMQPPIPIQFPIPVQPRPPVQVPVQPVITNPQNAVTIPTGVIIERTAHNKYHMEAGQLTRDGRCHKYLYLSTEKSKPIISISDRGTGISIRGFSGLHSNQPYASDIAAAMEQGGNKATLVNLDENARRFLNEYIHAKYFGKVIPCTKDGLMLDINQRPITEGLRELR